jgi:hypothetical protein
MIPVEAAIAQLDTLLNEYANLAAKARAAGSAFPESRLLESRIYAGIERFSIPGSVYAREAADSHKAYDRLSALVSVATALRDDMQAGWLDSIVELVHADTYSDFLEMAEGLLEQGYKDAAAVIAGSSLEVHIRALCIKHNVDIEVSGRLKKADTMNADLKKDGAYGALEQKQVTAWLDLRNSAAHGDYAKYDAKDVGYLIRGVRDFMIKYPA